MNVKSGISAEEISFSASHTLFVEGEEDSIDVSVLRKILPIRVKHLGTSCCVRSVAIALIKEHPKYYFLVDRDHFDDETVEKSWSSFPQSDMPNLLIWRKKELENYFIDPEYLLQSDYLSADRERLEDSLKKRIKSCAKEYLYIGAANRVIVNIRESLKHRWIDVFRDRSVFGTEDEALHQLQARQEFGEHRLCINKVTSSAYLEESFRKELNMLTGGATDLEWGKGRWLDLLPAKGIMHNILRSTLFTVMDKDGKKLSPNDQEKEIIKNLLSPTKAMPRDFVELRDLITKIMVP